MRLGKRILFGGIVILSIVALGLAIVSQFVSSSFYEEAWVVWIVGVFLWLVVGLSVDAESDDMTIEEVEEAQLSERRHMITSVVVLAVALVLLLCGMIARSVWNYAKTGEISLGIVNIQEANINDANIDDAQIDNAHIDDAQIDNAHIDDAQIDNAHINDAQIDNAHINDAQIDNAHIDDAQIDNAHIDDAQIDNAHIDDAQIDNAHIDNAVIDKGIIGSIISNITGSIGGSGGGSNSNNPITTRPAEPSTEAPTEPSTEVPTERPTSPNEEPTTQSPKLVISSDNYDSYGDPVVRSSNDIITIKISGCNISDIDYYWVNAETSAKQTSGISFVEISDGNYRLNIEEWVFNSAEDIQIKNPATNNQYYTVTIEHVY